MSDISKAENSVDTSHSYQSHLRHKKLRKVKKIASNVFLAIVIILISVIVSMKV